MSTHNSPATLLVRYSFSRLVLMTVVLSFTVQEPLSSEPKELTTKELRKLLGSPDSHERHEAWKRLNPEKTSHYKIITQIFGKLPWYDRDGATVALSKATTEKALKKIVRDLGKHKNPFVRQGMARALALMNDDSVYGHLYEALKDKNPFVRRVVVDALKVHKKEEAVEALIELFLTEQNPVVNTFIQHSLDELTQAFLGPNPQRWAAWWHEAKSDADYTLGKSDKEAKREAEKLGRKLRTKRRTLAGVLMETSERGHGDGVPILVIPEYGYSKATMLPFLSELEKNHKIIYIDLPPMKSFKNLARAGSTAIPYYPIDDLVGAFEELRKKERQEHFALMTSGLNSWIAMRYAQLYPKSLAGMIFLGPLSGTRQFAAATRRLQQTGEESNDIEMWHYGLSRQFNAQTGENNHEAYHRENDLEKPEGENLAIDRRAWSLQFKDERDSTISLLYPRKDHRLGSVAVPNFDLFREKGGSRRIPTLVIASESNMFTTVEDCKAVAAHYKGLWLLYKKSSCMPFAEESVRFNKDVGAFLKKYARKAPSSPKNKQVKDKDKKKKKKKKRTKKRKKRKKKKRSSDPAR